MARPRVRRSVALLTGLTALFALAGCNSNPSPAPLPSSSPSATPGESPSLTPPTIPAEAKGTSEASAKAFVRYYIDVLNFATATGDTKALTGLSGESCDSCVATVDRLEMVYRAGGSIQSEGWRIRTINLVPLQPKSKPIIEVGLVLSPQTVVEEPGADPQEFDGGKLPATFHLTSRGTSWAVTDWDRSA